MTPALVIASVRLQLLRPRFQNVIKHSWLHSTVVKLDDAVGKDYVVSRTLQSSDPTKNSHLKSDIKSNVAGVDLDDDLDDDEMEEEEMFVEADDSLGHKMTEWGGPRRGGRLPEPTRFGDWERKGRCTDF